MLSTSGLTLHENPVIEGKKMPFIDKEIRKSLFF
jgi:hypothetical protein